MRGVKIGNNCFIGHGVKFVNDKFSNGKVNFDPPFEETIIGNNVLIGSNSTILPITIVDNVNDILDKEFDAKVFRTKNRPIASGKVSIRLGMFYAFVLCLLAFLVLINFNLFILTVISFDIFSYIIGKNFGKNNFIL